MTSSTISIVFSGCEIKIARPTTGVRLVFAFGHYTHAEIKLNYDNIKFISSGMGDEDGDNFIVVNVNSDGSLSYDLICLSDTNIHCLGVLTDHLVVNEISFTVYWPSIEERATVIP